MSHWYALRPRNELLVGQRVLAVPTVPTVPPRLAVAMEKILVARIMAVCSSRGYFVGS